MTAPSRHLRVAMDVTPLIGVRTGVATFTYESLVRLARRRDLSMTGYAVTMRGTRRARSVLPAGVAPARGPMAARPLHRMWARWAFPPMELWTGKVDVVHGPNYVVPPARSAAQLVTVHDLTMVRFPQLASSATSAFPALVRSAVSRGAHVHAVSQFVAHELHEVLGIPEDRTSVVPNGVLPVPDVPASVGRELAGCDRYVLALGTVEPRKDLPSLVAAFDELAGADGELRLVIAGPDGWGAAQLSEAIASARHRDRVVRLGWVDEVQRAGLLRGAAVLAYPSLYEGFGIPPLEAMSAGTPVVTTTAGALPETVGEAALKVEPGDATALADALGRVLADEELASALVQAGERRVERFSWDDTADGLAGLYQGLAGHLHSRR